jgi:hypothetical protein
MRTGRVVSPQAGCGAIQTVDWPRSSDGVPDTGDIEVVITNRRNSQKWTGREDRQDLREIERHWVGIMAIAGLDERHVSGAAENSGGRTVLLMHSREAAIGNQHLNTRVERGRDDRDVPAEGMADAADP